MIKFFKIRCASKVTENPENHADLGLAEDKPEGGSLELVDTEVDGLDQRCRIAPCVERATMMANSSGG